MSPWPGRWRFFSGSDAARGRQRPYRPVLECLEERCLLSAGYAQVNLASDVPGLARVTDPNLVNPWGISFSPTGPFWFADNGTGVSDVLDGGGQPVPLGATVPHGSPTGVVFNGGPGFVVSENGLSAPSRFLFATEDGTISGWTEVVDPTRALLAVESSSAGAVYKGLALATDPAGQRFLYAADFGHGRIDVFDQNFNAVARPGSFQDPSLPSGFAPFNIQNVNNLLFVTYARQDWARRENVAGAGQGFIDVYDTGGNLIRRFASGGALNSPWGLALAPADFGSFGGSLLVGTTGDGRINAYDPASGAFLGPLADDNGMPITIPNLWALTFGNGHEGGAADTLFFAAGLDQQQHGLFGAIQAPQRKEADTAGAGTFDPDGSGEPGDYPLPPSRGPVFQGNSEDRPIPIADLLPLRESSLALVPTLSTISQPIARIDSPVSAAPIVGVSASDSQSARAAHHDAVALNTFLDVNASQNVPQNPSVQWPDTNPQAVGAASLPSADRAAGPEVLLPEAYVERLETQSSAEQDPGELPPSGQVDEVLAAAPPENRAESADDRAAGNESGLAQNGDWTTLMNLVFVVSLPMIWTCWLRHGTRSQQLSGEPVRSGRAKKLSRTEPLT